jgi:hypothetical protein
MNMSKSIIGIAAVVLAVPALMVAANAAPAGLGSAKPAVAVDSAAAPTQITWRKKHHRRYYRAHGVGAGVQLYVGERRHHRHHKWRKWHKHN